MYLLSDFANFSTQSQRRQGLSTGQKIGLGVGLVGLGVAGIGGLKYRRQIAGVFGRSKAPASVPKMQINPRTKQPFMNQDSPDVIAKKLARTEQLAKVKPGKDHSEAYRQQYREANRRIAEIKSTDSFKSKAASPDELDRVGAFYDVVEGIKTIRKKYNDRLKKGFDRSQDYKLRISPKVAKDESERRFIGQHNRQQVKDWRGFSAPIPTYY